MAWIRRLLISLVVTLLVKTAAATGPLPPGAGAADPTLVIGLMATLSGAGALVGQDLADGFDLGLDHLGRRLGGQEVRVVIADDKGSADVARQHLRRLLEREKLDIMLTGVSQPSLAVLVKPLIASKVFVLALDQAVPLLAGSECNPLFFSMAPLSDGAQEAMGQHLTSQRFRRIVVVTLETPATAGMIQALKRTFSGEISEVLAPKPGETTFARELKRIAELSPDGVYVHLGSGMGGAFIRAYAASPLKGQIPLLTSATTTERQLLAGMGEAALDLTSVSTWSPDIDTPSNKRLVPDFEMKFGRPATVWAAQGYDAALLLDGALKITEGKTDSGEAFRNALRKADFISTRGTFRFNANQFPILSYSLRKVVKDQRGKLTQEASGMVLKEWRDHMTGCPMEPLPSPAPQGKKGGAKKP